MTANLRSFSQTRRGSRARVQSVARSTQEYAHLRFLPMSCVSLLLLLQQPFTVLGQEAHSSLRVVSHIPKINRVLTDSEARGETQSMTLRNLPYSPTAPDLSTRRSLLRGAAEPGITVNPNWDCSSDFAACAEIRPLLLFKAANIDPFGLLNWTIPCSLGPVQQAQDRAYEISQRRAQGTPSKASDFLQCEAGRAFICKSWIGVTCKDKQVDSLIVNPTLLFPPTGAPFETRRSLWGNWSVGQSIPPELGKLQALSYLDLSNNYESGGYLGGLIGTIPDTLSKLTKLTYLSLSSNRLWGSIPDSLGNLVNLQYLGLSINNFTGAIPPSIGSMRNLTMLVLGTNFGMRGSIPGTLGNLVNLQYLSLASLPLGGAIPDDMSLLAKLTYMDMTLMDLSGPLPAWFGQMASLGALLLGKNQLSGTIPQELGGLSQLAALDLSDNQLSGSIPAAVIEGICRSPNFYSIDLSQNQLSGPLPYGMSKCTALQTLTLSYNQLSGSFPDLAFFQAMPAVNQLQLSNNLLSGVVPYNLTSQTMLATLFLDGNQLSGPLPRVRCLDSVLNYNFSRNLFNGTLEGVLDVPGLSNCSSSSNQGLGAFDPANITLDLSYNQLSGSIPVDFLTLDNMQDLRLHSNQLQGPLPEEFNCSRLLQIFTASGNSLTGAIPSTLGSCTGLQVLALAGTQLTGTIPDALKGIGASLQRLELQKNSLNGSLPGSVNFFQQLRTLNVSGNSLNGPLHQNISQLPNLFVLDLSRNKIDGPLPDDMGNLTVLHTMDLSDNAFSGEIPVTIAPPNLPLLKSLDLSNNNLNGSIPWGFTNSSAANLTINLSENSLSGPIPGGVNSTFALTLAPSSVAGNPGLCGGSGYDPCPDPNAGQLSTGALVGICVGAGVALLGIAALTYWLIRKRNEWAGGTMLVFEKLDFHLTVDDILEATENFSDTYKLGRGGFGTVYRATLQDGRTVAIKRLASQSTQGDREFQAEMQTLGNIRHRNLVVLVAAYIAPAPSAERLLIYNYLSGGSLDNILSSTKEMTKDSPYRQWEVRRRIALDVARGMKYLHHDCTPRIIHRDMKPANVLMDDDLVAHVADFGLARELDATKSHMSTAVFGTIGYLAPEYTQRGRLTFKSDVFAYGVLLLQLITGKQPTDEDVAERGLARWVGGSATASVMDDRMEIGPYTNQILGAIKLGLLCTSRVPADRPSMAEVVHLLENLDDFAKGITAPEDTPAEKEDDQESV